MSRFYGTLSGRSRTPATRCGDRSGMSAHVRGWDLGASISLSVVGEQRRPSGKIISPGTDLLSLCLTSGSNDGRVLLDLGQWQRATDGTLLPACSRANLILLVTKGTP